VVQPGTALRGCKRSQQANLKLEGGETGAGLQPELTRIVESNRNSGREVIRREEELEQFFSSVEKNQPNFNIFLKKQHQGTSGP